MSALDRFELQGSLFAAAPPGLGSLSEGTRRHLDDCCWIDWFPGWLAGTDDLFARLVGDLPWAAHRRPMYDRVVDVPRLTATLDLDGERVPDPVARAARRLASHYGVAFRTVGFSLYRDGRDSVAWHGDRLRGAPRPAVVALVALGAPRPFLIRPAGGGPSRRHDPGHGDLLVMGGSCQQHWEHSVPKVARAEPRLSMVFRSEA